MDITHQAYKGQTVLNYVVINVVKLGTTFLRNLFSIQFQVRVGQRERYVESVWDLEGISELVANILNDCHGHM